MNVEELPWQSKRSSGGPNATRYRVHGLRGAMKSPDLRLSTSAADDNCSVLAARGYACIHELGARRTFGFASSPDLSWLHLSKHDLQSCSLYVLHCIANTISLRLYPLAHISFREPCRLVEKQKNSACRFMRYTGYRCLRTETVPTLRLNRAFMTAT